MNGVNSIVILSMLFLFVNCANADDKQKSVFYKLNTNSLNDPSEIAEGLISFNDKKKNVKNFKVKGSFTIYYREDVWSKAKTFVDSNSEAEVLIPSKKQQIEIENDEYLVTLTLINASIIQNATKKDDRNSFSCAWTIQYKQYNKLK